LVPDVKVGGPVSPGPYGCCAYNILVCPPLPDIRRESFQRRSLLAGQRIRSDDFSEVQSVQQTNHATQNVGESDFDRSEIQ